MKVLVVGHWDLSGEDLSDTGGDASLALTQVLRQPAPNVGEGPNYRALAAVQKGMLRAVSQMAPKMQLPLTRSFPIGPASALLETLKPGGPATGSFFPLVHGRKEASTVALGSELRDLGNFQGTVVIEGGHSWSHDRGIGMLGALVQDLSLSLDSTPEELRHALEKAREYLSSRTIVFAASTSRPLWGSGGTSTIRPDMSLFSSGSGFGVQANSSQSAIDRLAPATESDDFATNIERETTWRSVLKDTYEKTIQLRTIGTGDQLRVVSSSTDSIGIDPTTIDGSGAAGGAAAIFAALGFPVVPTAIVFTSALNLKNLLKDTDLVVVLEPHLDGPEMSESTFGDISSLVAKEGVPLVAVTSRCSLSAPERADWGIHGVCLLRSQSAGVGLFEDAGRRIGQTWLAPRD